MGNQTPNVTEPAIPAETMATPDRGTEHQDHPGLPANAPQLPHRTADEIIEEVDTAQIEGMRSLPRRFAQECARRRPCRPGVAVGAGQARGELLQHTARPHESEGDAAGRRSAGAGDGAAPVLRRPRRATAEVLAESPCSCRTASPV